MLSVSCRAAIKAVIFLGSRYESGMKSSIKDITSYIQENENTVGKLLQKLVKAEIINSTKGPAGGFFITAKQGKQKVIKIVDEIDGVEVFKECGLGLTKCSERRPCPLHHEFKEVRNLFKKMCEEKRICDLYDNVNNGMAYLIS